MKETINVTTVQETLVLAELLGEKIEKKLVITLEGDLGAGKTTFTKGLGKGLGVKRIISSPTFTIIKEYEGRLPLYHIDAYRLEYSDEDIGLAEYINTDAVSVVEWAKFIEEDLPADRLDINIKYINETEREISFESMDDSLIETLRLVFNELEEKNK